MKVIYGYMCTYTYYISASVAHNRTQTSLFMQKIELQANPL